MGFVLVCLYVFEVCLLVCSVFLCKVSNVLFVLFLLYLLSCILRYEWFSVFLVCFSLVPLLPTSACSGAL